MSPGSCHRGAHGKDPPTPTPPPKEGEVRSQLCTAQGRAAERVFPNGGPASLCRPRPLTLCLHGATGRHRPRHTRQTTRAASRRARGLAQVDEMRRDETQARYTSVLPPRWLLAAAEKSLGRKGMRTGLCVCVCTYDVLALHVHPPHPRQEGPLGETVDLPTCRVFAKTKTQDFEGNPRLQRRGPGGAGRPPRWARPWGGFSLSFSVARF